MPNLDFILPTCPGLSDSTWLAASAYITAITNVCWKLLAPVVCINMLWKGVYDSTDRRIDLIGLVKLFAQILGVIFFFKYSKRLLFTFDLFIDFLCPSSMEVTSQIKQQLGEGVQQMGKKLNTMSLPNALFKGIIGVFDGILLFSHYGAIKVVHYFKAIVLILLSIFSPLAAIFSLLPGPFKKSFQTWLKSYVTVSCWTITLTVLHTLSETALSVAYVHGKPIESAFHLAFSFVLLIATFMTPMWTSMFMNGVLAPDLMGATAQTAQNLAKKLISKWK